MKRLIIVVLLLINYSLYSQVNINGSHLNRIINNSWVDSVYNQLTPEQRIAQLFWITAEEIRNNYNFKERISLIGKYQPGGILFMKNDAESIAHFVNKANSVSLVPPIMVVDAEYGLAMRIDGVTRFPDAMTMGAVKDLKMHYMMGNNVAQQLKRMGIHVDLAPVADVNSNPLNPIIGSRSYGENPVEVAKRSVAFMLGLQNEGVMAVAKHFPGHGDTDTDSHLDLPVVNRSREILDSIDLLPFRALIKNGILGIMTGHIEVPALEEKSGLPASLSKSIVTDLLKVNMGFEGLVITDAMNMQGVKKKGEPGVIDAMALAAGNDIIESTENLPKAIDEVNKLIKDSTLTWTDIENKCKKVLTLKRLLGIDQFRLVKTENCIRDLNEITDSELIQSFYDQSITKIGQNDTGKVAPLEEGKLLIKLDGFDTDGLLDQELDTGWSSFVVENVKGADEIKNNNKFDRIVIGLTSQPNDINIWNDNEFQMLVNDLDSTKKLTVIYVGSPYSLKKFNNILDKKELVIGYESVYYTYKSLAKYLTGKLIPDGKLPVSLCSILKTYSGN